VIKIGGFENIFSTIYEAVCYISTLQSQRQADIILEPQNSVIINNSIMTHF